VARGPSVAVARGCAVREGGDAGRGGCTRPHQSKFARPARWVSPRRQEWMRWQQGQVQGRRGEVGRLADCLPRWHAVARLRRYCEARWHCFGRGDGGPPAVVECARPRGPGAGRRPWWYAHGRAIPVRQPSLPDVRRVGAGLWSGPVRVASPVGGAQGTPEEARPAWVTLPENQVLRRFGPPAPYLPPLSSSQWCLVRASARRWGLVGTSLSAYWPLFVGLRRVLLHYDTYGRKD